VMFLSSGWKRRRMSENTPKNTHHLSQRAWSEFWPRQID
jgi:hypothetical protein